MSSSAVSPAGSPSPRNSPDGRTAAAERVGGEHDRRAVPRRLLGREVLAAARRSDRRRSSCRSSTQPSSWRRNCTHANSVARAVVQPDRVERHHELARLGRGDPRLVRDAAHAAARRDERVPLRRRCALRPRGRAARRRGSGSTSPSPSVPCRGSARAGARSRWRASRATAPSRDARGRAVRRPRSRSAATSRCSTSR